jgi:hypothetical protein
MRSALTLAVLTFGAGYRVLPTRKRTVANVARMAQVGRTETDGRRVPVACGERLTHLASRLDLAALLDVGVA